jgi:hypothetical protein
LNYNWWTQTLWGVRNGSTMLHISTTYKIPLKSRSRKACTGDFHRNWRIGSSWLSWELWMTLITCICRRPKSRSVLNESTNILIMIMLRLSTTGHVQREF